MKNPARRPGILAMSLAIRQQDPALRTDLLLKTGLARTGIAPAEIATQTGSPVDSITPGHQARESRAPG
jgi:hypothetical protein